MADNTNDLSISLGLDPTGLRSGLTEAERLIESSSQRIRSSIERIGNLGQQLAGLGATMTASLTVPIIGLATASVKAYGDIQALQKGLEAVAGSTSLASKQFNELKEVAKLPGLGLQEAVKGSINLQAIGLTADKSKEILLQFGNAVATVGKGRVEFDRAIYGITQLANTEFPLGEDLNIVADALPQVRTLLKDTFGKTRSDDLAKMGVTSKMVLDTILKGLTDLPRVNGGIKNAFENLGDSVQQNLARIGERIDKTFDISGIIDKLTNALDIAITYFEDLSPSVQKVILVVAGLTAVAGPLILAVGGFMALLPTIISGVTALGAAFTFLTGPIGLAIVAITAIAGSLAYYYATSETATDRQERLNDSLEKATISARKENEELKKLYETSQDQTKSLKERNKAVDQLQKQYPAYFGNLTNEAILAGKAGEAYRGLTGDIIKASRARAATAELDKRSAGRLEKELELTKKLKDALRVFYSDNPEAVIKFNQENPFDGIDGRQGVKAGAKKYIKTVLSEISNEYKSALSEDRELKKIIEEGVNPISKLDTSAIETNAKTNAKKVVDAKKKAEKYVYQNGSEGYYLAEIQRLEELKKRAQFDSDVWRELAKQIETYQELLNPKEIEPVKIKSAGFMDGFGNEYKTYVDLLVAQSKRVRGLRMTTPESLDEATLKILEATERQKIAIDGLNESLSKLFTSNISEGISDAFASIGTSLANGENVLKSLGKSLLGSFGKILSELGKQLVEYGVGLLAIKISMKTLNPYVAIAAGAALIALGAGVTASINKQSDSVGGGGKISSSSGVSNSTGFSSSNYSGGGLSGGEYVFRLSGPDLVATFNRNVSADDRVKAG